MAVVDTGLSSSVCSVHSGLWAGAGHGLCGDSEAAAVGGVHRLHRRGPAHLHTHVVSRDLQKELDGMAGSIILCVCLSGPFRYRVEVVFGLCKCWSFPMLF